MCNACKRESHPIISRDTWSFLVLLDRGLELSLKKVIFLMKTGLCCAAVSTPFSYILWKKYAYVHVCKKVRKGGNTIKSNN